MNRIVGMTLVAVLGVFGIAACSSQVDEPEPLNLRAEIDRIIARDFEPRADQPVVVITGSSSIRLWSGAKEAFPDVQIVNTGFGGSTMADLAQHSLPLITRFQPEQVIVHEGDNDLAAGLTPLEVMTATRLLVAELEAGGSGPEIVLLSAKPSVARWHNHEAYEDLNARFQRFALSQADVSYVDVWSRMLNEQGEPNPLLYGNDGLHLNDAGYELWRQAIAPYLD